MKYKTLLTLLLLIVALLISGCEGCADNIERYHKATKPDLEKIAQQQEDEKEKEEQFKKKFQTYVSSAEIVINGANITYRGKLLPMYGHIDRWIEVLGKPDRIDEIVYTWDNLGLSCVIDKKNNSVKQFEISIRLGRRFAPNAYTEDEPKEGPWDPKNAYAGSIRVDGAIINKDTPRSLQNYKKKGDKFKVGYFPGFFTSVAACPTKEYPDAYILYTIYFDYKKQVYSFVASFDNNER